MNSAAAQQAADTQEIIAGEVEIVTYRNEDSGYSIMRVAVRGQRDPVTVVGTSLAQTGEIVTCKGRWKMHPKFGRQLEADDIAVDRPTSPQAIERYLASGVVKGIGPAIAKRIVNEFGADTFRVLDEEPHRIGAIKGVGKQRAEDIAELWKKTEGERALQVFLAEYDIMGAKALRIIRQFGSAAIEIVESQPYRLAREVRGIGFLIADTIAQRVGIPVDSPERIEAGLRHVVTTAGGMGNCGRPYEHFLEEAVKLLSLNRDLIAPELDTHLRLGDFIVRVVLDSEVYVFDKRLYRAEQYIAETLSSMTTVPPWNVSKSKAHEIADESEKACGVTLAPEQKEAVIMALLRPLSILTGGPGTGKTSTLKVILDALHRVRARVLLGAPTGKAAKRMTESTGLEASTIARMIGMGRGPDAPPPKIECSILIIDESSMVDVLMLQSVLKHLEPGAAILFVGDVDQLPSVGAGRVLGDLIDSNIIPTTRLTKVFRQAATSAIIRNAHRINRGHSIEAKAEGQTDFYFIESDIEQVPERIAAMVATQVTAKTGIAPRDVQVLSPMRRTASGTLALNELLQRKLNPYPGDVIEKAGKRFGVGDRVLQTVNNYDLGVMNGESGVIVVVDKASDTLVVEVDGANIVYPFSDLDQLDLAYAMTIHKSQGSQFPAVVIPVTTQHYMMLQRSIIYTGITRATKFCVLVGQRKALEQAIRNMRIEPRITSLQAHLESGF